AVHDAGPRGGADGGAAPLHLRAGRGGRRPGSGLRGDRAEDVEVGGKVAGGREDDGAVRAQASGGGHRLVESQRGGVTGHGRAGRGADERSDSLADPLGEIPPSVVVPGTDEIVAPLLDDGALDDVGNMTRERAE